MKQVVFNVGGALASYIEIGSKRIIIDAGKNDSFCPIKDFLIPLYDKRKEPKDNDKYHLDQVILSHPHNDHISAIESLYNNFSIDLLTTPNDNQGMLDKDKINWDLVDNPDDKYTSFLRKKMLPGRTPPLKSTNPTDLFIYYIAPTESESDNNTDLSKSNYTNNTSIATYLKINNNKIFMPGDLMKDGMDYIIKNESSLRRHLGEGVDILIAPHHGLKSSFSTKLFSSMKDNKTRCLNIISEKKSTTESNRVVDPRYSSSEYCKGENNFSTKDNIVCQKKTSTGHIFIDYNQSNKPKFEMINDPTILIKRFV